jgi:hypothetical protein
MEDAIVYVACKIIKVGNNCRMVPLRDKKGLIRIDGEVRTVDVNPDLVYNAKMKLPTAIFSKKYPTFYDTCIALGHTDSEAREFLNKYLLFSEYKTMPAPPILAFDDLYEMVVADEAAMDAEFKRYENTL